MVKKALSYLGIGGEEEDPAMRSQKEIDLHIAQEALDNPAVQKAFSRLKTNISYQIGTYVGPDPSATDAFYVKCGNLLRSIYMLENSLYAPLLMKKMADSEGLQQDPEAEGMTIEDEETLVH